MRSDQHQNRKSRAINLGVRTHRFFGRHMGVILKSFREDKRQSWPSLYGRSRLNLSPRLHRPLPRQIQVALMHTRTSSPSATRDIHLLPRPLDKERQRQRKPQEVARQDVSCARGESRHRGVPRARWSCAREPPTPHTTGTIREFIVAGEGGMNDGSLSAVREGCELVK